MACSPSSARRGGNGPQHGALGVDALAVAGVAAADQFVDEAAVVLDRVEVARAAQQQRVLDGALEMAVGGLDHPILMGQPAVVAAGCHTVMAAQAGIPGGPVLLDLRGEIVEGGREAVAAVLARRAAEGPERVLHPGGQGYEALAAEHDIGVLEAAEGEAEVVEAVRQRRSRHRHADVRHVGEVGEAEPARLVGLAEDHLPLRPVQRPPLANAPLERPPHPGAQLGMPAHQLLEDGDRPQARARLQHGNDLGVEDDGQGIGPPSLARRALLGGQARVLRNAVAGGGAEPRPGGGNRDRVGRSVLHEEPHLVIGHMAAGHERSSEAEKAPA